MRVLNCEGEPFNGDLVDLFCGNATVEQKNAAIQRRVYPVM